MATGPPRRVTMRQEPCGDGPRSRSNGDRIGCSRGIGERRRGGDDRRGRRRRRRGRSRVRRPVPAATAAEPGVLRRGARGRRRRGGHLVLEPLPRGPLRHHDGRLLLQLGSRAGSRVAVVGEVRHPAGDPPLPAARRRQARPPPRHPLLDQGGEGHLGRGSLELADPHQCRRRDHLPSLRDGHGLPVPAQGPRHRGRRAVPGRRLLDHPVAPRRRRLHRQARRRDRDGFVGGAVHPDHRRAGLAADRVPAHAQLLPAGQERARTAGQARRLRRWARGVPGGGAMVGGRRDAGHARGRSAPGLRGGAAGQVRGGLGVG